MASHKTADTVSTERRHTAHNTRTAVMVVVHGMSSEGQQAPMPLSTAEDTLNITQLKMIRLSVSHEIKQGELILAQCLYKVVQYKQFTIKIHRR